IPGPAGDDTVFPYTLTKLKLQPFSNDPNGDPLVITADPPANVTAGSPFSLVVKAEYEDGSVNTKFNGQITLSLSGTNTSATLKGVVTVSAVNGVATFTNLIVNQTADGLRIVASTPTLPPVLSDRFNVISPVQPALASSRPAAVQLAVQGAVQSAAVL